MAEEGDAEVDHVFDAFAGRLACGPQLQVLDPVVQLDAVDVMDIFGREQLATKDGRS